MYVKATYHCRTLNGVSGVPTSGVRTTVIIVSLLTGILKNTKNEFSLILHCLCRVRQSLAVLCACRCPKFKHGIDRNS